MSRNILSKGESGLSFKLIYICCLWAVAAIFILTFHQAKAKIPSINFIYEKQKWEFDVNKIADTLDIEKNTFFHLKNTSIYLPIITDGENFDFSANAIDLNLMHARGAADWELDNNAVVDMQSFIEIITIPQVKISSVAGEKYLDAAIIKKIEKNSSDVKIYTDKNKKIIIKGKGQNGLKVVKNLLLDGINLALNANINRVVVPVVEQKAKVDVSANLRELGIKALIAVGHSAFAGSRSGRVRNIQTGTAHYNALLVKPGAIFSFNQHLGPVDKEHDFVEELVIKPEGTIPEYGGGLCQVSSTLFRAALFGGFPIIERAPHSYAVSYYAQVGGPGLDGTVYPGSHDVKFFNDSPAHILIQAYTEGDHVWFKFYGTDDGRKTSLEGPYLSNSRDPGPAEIVETDKLPAGVKKQVEKNHAGFDVNWYRYITKNGLQQKETIFSRYRAISEKVLIGKKR